MATPSSKSSPSTTSPRPATLAHLLKYDSILGNLKNEIAHGADFISVDGKQFKVFAERDPAKLDWASVGAQIVVESTGLFTDITKAWAGFTSTHRRQQRCVTPLPPRAPTTPSSSASTTKPTIPPRTRLSPTPVTTNCLAPVCKVLHDTYGIGRAS